MTTTTRSSSSRRKLKKPTVVQRLDIQGLRMLAVMLVVLDHLFAWPQGGFIGVDVFFVISGFLITGQLLKSLDRTGRVSFSDFYRKRLRRIFPAATLVLAATCLAAYPIFSTSRFQSTLVDGGWAFAFMANWRFGLEGTDYFNADGPVSPFQHYWSLSVEEQFYVVWPVVIMLIGILVARNSLANMTKTVIAASVMGTVVAVSFGWALAQSANDQTWAYFSTFTRVWELGVGALLAIGISAFDRIPDTVRPFLAWMGILAIAVGAFTITESSGFPAPGAALPVVGAALVIGAGVKGQQRLLQPLTNRASVYIGDISYSLYLWHWPVIILLGSLMNESIYFYAASFAFMFALSVASYHFFEDPIRHSSWLVPRADSKSSKFSRKRFAPSLRWTSTVQNAGIAALALLTIGVSAFAVQPSEITTAPTRTPSLSFRNKDAPSSEEISRGPAGTALAKRIEDAVSQTEWPELNPSMDDAITGQQAIPEAIVCGSVTLTANSSCTWGSPSAPQTMMVLGDSIAMSYLGPLKSFAENSTGRWKVSSEVTAGCPFADVAASQKDAAIVAACPNRRIAAIRAVNEAEPDVVVIVNSYTTVPQDQWYSGVSRLTDQFTANVGKIVFLSPPPSDIKISDCYNRIHKPADCISRVTGSWYERSASEKKLAESVDGIYIDTRPWFCTPDDYCPSFVGKTPMKQDSAHITPEYGEFIAPVVAETLNSAGL